MRTVIALCLSALVCLIEGCDGTESVVRRDGLKSDTTTALSPEESVVCTVKGRRIPPLTGGFDCRLMRSESELMNTAISSKRMRSAGNALERKVRECIRAPWIPLNTVGFLVPVRGSKDEPDAFVFRHEVAEKLVELVVREKSLTVSMFLLDASGIDTPEKARNAYLKWCGELTAMAVEPEKFLVNVRDKGAYWFVDRDLEEERRHGGPYPWGAGGREAWSWPESVAMALDKNGEWLSMCMSYGKGTGGPVAGWSFRLSGTWFDEWLEGEDEEP